MSATNAGQHCIESDTGRGRDFADESHDNIDEVENTEDNTDGDEDNESNAESYGDPPYTSEEITGRILKFYEFLTTLHFDAADLRVPPPSGWPHTPDPEGDDELTGKSPLVRSVLKHLPYFVPSGKPQIHHNCHIVDFSDYAAQVESMASWDDYFSDVHIEEWDDPPIYPADVLVFAEGYESSGRSLVLVPKRGHIFTELGGGCGTVGPEDVMAFFDNLESQYEKLDLLGLPGRETIEAPSQLDELSEVPPFGYCPEAEKEIKYDDVIEHIKPDDQFNTTLNVQYLRQVLRKHGWPGKFDKKAAMAEVEQLDEAFEAKGEMGWMKVCR